MTRSTLHRWAASMTAACLTCAAAAQGPDSQVAAVVNGDKITVGDWRQRMQNLRAQDFILTASPIRFKPASGGQIALEALITSRLLLQYAAKTSLLPSDAEVDAVLANLKKRPEVQQSLQRGTYTEAQLRNEVIVQNAYFNVATINLSVTPEEVKGWYDRHADQYSRPEQWRLAVIRSASKEAADKVAASIRGGMLFETAAAQFSEDKQTGAKGGDIGNLSASDPTIPENLREAVKKLKVGEWAGPLPILRAGTGQGGFWLVRLTAKQPGFVTPLDQVREEARRAALLEKAAASGGAEKKLADFRKTSTVEILLPGYK